jgi:hypothetical protein
MIKRRAALIGTLPGLRAESWSQDARRLVQLGPTRSKKRRASTEQPRTNRGFQDRYWFPVHAVLTCTVGGLPPE